MKIVRRRGLLGLALLVPLALFTLSGCSALVQRALTSPTVEVSKIDLRALTLKGADLRIDLDLANPNGFGLVLQSVDYRMRINGRTFVHGVLAERTEILAHGAQRLRLPVTLLYDDLRKVLETFDGRRTPRYVMEADVQLLVPVLGLVSVPVRDEGNVPLGSLDQVLGAVGNRSASPAH